MEHKSILIIDDEKNIRLTMSMSLESLGMPVETAVNGEEGLEKLAGKEFGLVFLDLKMPGMDGIEVLRRIAGEWPITPVIIVTAHGSVESAVETMKLGAVDFIQKPFSPEEIRELASQVLEREALDEATAADYHTMIELAKRSITLRSFDAARAMVRKAIGVDPGQPEAYNLLGVLLEIDGDRVEAQKFYRASLDIDPTYKPAWANLDRTTSWNKLGTVDLGPERSTTASGTGGAKGNKHRN